MFTILNVIKPISHLLTHNLCFVFFLMCFFSVYIHGLKAEDIYWNDSLENTYDIIYQSLHHKSTLQDSDSINLSENSLLRIKKKSINETYYLRKIINPLSIDYFDKVLVPDAITDFYDITKELYKQYYQKKIELINMKNKAYIYLSIKEAQTKQGFIQFRIPLNNFIINFIEKRSLYR